MVAVRPQKFIRSLKKSATFEISSNKIRYLAAALQVRGQPYQTFPYRFYVGAHRS